VHPMQNFYTHHLALAATLLNEKVPFLGLDRSAAKVEFVFEDSQRLQEILDRYWRDELLCPAQSLLSSFRRAKHLLYDGGI